MESLVQGDPDEWFDIADYRHHAAWALSLFRTRLRLAQEIDFLVVVGGKDDAQCWGRFSGIAEEVMLALAFNKPVYLVGIAGGAAKAVGSLMGLASTHGTVSRCLREPSSPDRSYQAFTSLLSDLADNFEVPHLPNLPRTIVELKDFLAARAPGTDKWPSNGLTKSENRELLNCQNNNAGMTRCVELIELGIIRLNWG